MRGAFCPHCGHPTRSGARFCAGCGSLLAVGSAVLRPGALLQGDRYRVVRLLGRGGNGAVYLTEDTRLARPCVAKELQGQFPSLAERRRAEADFQREALILARLSTEHPGLPQTYDFFSEGGRHYLVMQHVAGLDLESRLRTGGPLAESEALGLGAAVAEVLAFLHSQQPEPVIHRDIKPANLIVDTRERVKLVDFGLAKALPSTTAARRAGAGHTGAAGTAGYTPLEQWMLRAEPRSDVYALGATLHHLLTGRDPRDGFGRHAELNLDLIRRLGVFPPLRQMRSDLSRSLETLIMAMLAADPGGRPPAAEVQATLAGLLKPGRSRIAPRPVRPPPAAPAPQVRAVPLLGREVLAAGVAAWLHSHTDGLPPAEPITLLAARAELVPVALGRYHVQARFEEPGGRLLHAIDTQGIGLLDGVGQPLDPPLAAFLAAALPAFPPPLPAPPAEVSVQPFILDARQLRDALLTLLTTQHTRRVEYVAATGRTYTRTCKPGRKAILLADDGPALLHHPRWALDVSIRGHSYHLDAYQAAPGAPGPALWVVAHTLSGSTFCAGCGNFLAPPGLVACATCGRRVCLRCAVQRSRLGIFRKYFCGPTCAQTFAARESVLGWL